MGGSAETSCKEASSLATCKLNFSIKNCRTGKSWAEWPLLLFREVQIVE